MPANVLRRAIVALVLLVAVLVPGVASAAPPPAGGLVQLAPPNACLANAAVGGCANTGAFQFPTDIATSRDGRDVYVANASSGVVGLRRAPATGALTVNTGARQGFDLPRSVAVDPGGARVAVASGDPGLNGRLALFPRGADGKLGAAAKCAVEFAEAGCTEVDGLSGARQVALPPSGPGIYVSGETGGGDDGDVGTQGDGALVALSRNAATGELSQLACIPHTAVPDAGDACHVFTQQPGVGGVLAAAVSPDGRQVYAGGFDGLVGFNRDASTGNLGSRTACFLRFESFSSCPQDPRIAIPEDIAFSPDGRHMYIAARTSVVVFARQTLSGALSFVECLNADGSGGCRAGAPGLTFGVSSIAVSPDGRTVYAAGGTLDDVRSFRRDPATGKLTQLACVNVAGANGCTGAAGLHQTRAIAISPDGVHAYIAAQDGPGSGDTGAVALFSLERAPVCGSRAVTVPAGGAVALPLACTDPNGEAVKRAVAAGPAHGSLGAISQAAGTVAYRPAAGFAGTDDVAYTATDGTNVSARAHIAITVTPAPDTTAPRSRIARIPAGRVKRLHGTAADAGGVRAVEIALVRRGATCKQLTRAGTLKRPRRGTCAPTRFLAANGTSSWTFRLSKRLPKGRYVLVSRATDAAGNRERTFTAARGNRVTFTVR